MQVDFFDSQYAQTTNAINFGICDDQDKSPAYIDITHIEKWVADVRNVNGKTTTFHPIDNCIATLRPDGNMDNRCDGLLRYDNNLIFVELKDRNNQGWLGHGLKQLKSSISHFKTMHPDLLNSITIKAHLCNKQRPSATTSYNTNRSRFKDETGYIVEINRVITVK